MFCVSDMPNTSSAEVKELQSCRRTTTSTKSLSSPGLAACLKLAGEDTFPSIPTLTGSGARVQGGEGKVSHGFTLGKSAWVEIWKSVSRKEQSEMFPCYILYQ